MARPGTILVAALLAAGLNQATAVTPSSCVDARQSGLPEAVDICQLEWRNAQAAGDSLAASQALFQLAILARRPSSRARPMPRLSTSGSSGAPPLSSAPLSRINSPVSPTPCR